MRRQTNTINYSNELTLAQELILMYKKSSFKELFLNFFENYSDKTAKGLSFSDRLSEIRACLIDL